MSTCKRSKSSSSSCSPVIGPRGPRGYRGEEGPRGEKGERGPRGHHRSAHYLNRKINNINGQDYSGGTSIYLPIMNLELLVLLMIQENLK